MCNHVSPFIKDENLAKIIFHHADWSGDIDSGKLREKAFIPRKGNCCFSLIRATFLDIHFTKGHIVKEMIKPPSKNFYGFSIIPYNEIKQVDCIVCEVDPAGDQKAGLDEHANVCLYYNGERYHVEKQKRNKIPEDLQIAIDSLLNIAKRKTFLEKVEKREFPKWCGERVPEFEDRNIYI